MSSHFDRVKTNPSTALFASQIDDIHAHTRVGKHLVKNSQLVNLHQNNTLARIKQTVSAPSTTLSSPGSFIEFRVEPYSLKVHVGNNERYELSVTNNTGSTITPYPVPLWFDHIDYVDGSSTVVQRSDGQTIWDHYLTLPQEKWRTICNLIGCDPFTFKGKPIPNGATVVYYLDPLISFISQLHPFLPHLKPFYIRLYIGSSIMESGNPPSLNYCDLLISGQELGPTHYNQLMERHRSYPHDYKIYTWLNMQYQKTLNSAQTYTDTLSNIKGLCSDLFLSFRASPLSTAPNQRQYYAISTYDLLNSGGITIIGDPVKSDYDRFISFPEKFDSLAAHYLPVYHYSFAQDIDSVISTASNYGTYFFTGFEQLRYVTPSTVTNPVITLTANNPPSSGFFRLIWTDPLSNITAVTDPIAYNDLASTIKSALEALPNFRGTVTVSASLSSGTVTFTFTGAYSGESRITAASLQCDETSINVGGVGVKVTSSLTTPGVPGWSNGDYIINILARVYGHLIIDTDGSLKIANTY